MRVRFTDIPGLVKQAALKWNADNCLRLGASLSYYTILSLFPLILVVLAIIQALLANSDAARDIILDGLSRVTGGFRDEFVTALAAAQRTRPASSAIGLATLLLGASWVFGELVSAFNIIWGIEAADKGGPWEFLRVTFFSFALVLAVSFLLLVSLIFSAILSALGTVLMTLPGGPTLWTLVNTLINFAILTLIFAILFKYLPQTTVEWGDVWIGAFLTAIIWTLLQLAISYYITWSSYKNYGAIGAIMALVAWVYFSSQILFLGGEFTSVYAKRFGSRVE